MVESTIEITNIKKHNVNFMEAVETFFDQKHSQNELRYFWIGKTLNNRILTTWFTKRDQQIRIIGSASFRKFRRFYETTQNI